MKYNPSIYVIYYKNIVIEGGCKDIMKRLLFLPVCFIVIMLNIVGCSNSTNKISGKLKGNKYTNEHFGITIEFPKEWDVLKNKKPAVITMMENRLPKSATENNIDIFSAICPGASESPSLTPAIHVYLEELTEDIESEKEYLTKLKNKVGFQSILTYKFDKDVDTVEIDGKDIHVINATITDPSFMNQQQYYAILDDDYAFVITVMYFGDDEKEKIDELLEHISFDE